MIDLADLTRRFGAEEIAQLTAAEPGGSIDAEVVGRAIAEAVGLVEAALQGRYTLPLTPLPALIAGAACDLARARLYRDALPDVVAKRADDARRLLDQIASGRLLLGAAPLAAAATGVDFAAPAQVMATSPYAA
jgi:phage gp36-like protein